ncbi:hypothetical protein BJ508DRAFT_334241 [Ascobolus immersus RN42]|uniref:Uncharacterized protein n=1 Tax=Ascobolus immersus RN42 TaxID=1160509 RepID=A0A3N4HK60_ASCIM|nr:hypothetical protein BJ508DRAFT_334241 [Ascobolus immersus RN42]
MSRKVSIPHGFTSKFACQSCEQSKRTCMWWVPPSVPFSGEHPVECIYAREKTNWRGKMPNLFESEISDDQLFIVQAGRPLENDKLKCQREIINTKEILRLTETKLLDHIAEAWGDVQMVKEAIVERMSEDKVGSCVVEKGSTSQDDEGEVGHGIPTAPTDSAGTTVASDTTPSEEQTIDNGVAHAPVNDESINKGGSMASKRQLGADKDESINIGGSMASKRQLGADKDESINIGGSMASKRQLGADNDAEDSVDRGREIKRRKEGANGGCIIFSVEDVHEFAASSKSVALTRTIKDMERVFNIAETADSWDVFLDMILPFEVSSTYDGDSFSVMGSWRGLVETKSIMEQLGIEPRFEQDGEIPAHLLGIRWAGGDGVFYSMATGCVVYIFIYMYGLGFKPENITRDMVTDYVERFVERFTMKYP